MIGHHLRLWCNNAMNLLHASCRPRREIAESDIDWRRGWASSRNGCRAHSIMSIHVLRTSPNRHGIEMAFARNDYLHCIYRSLEKACPTRPTSESNQNPLNPQTVLRRDRPRFWLRKPRPVPLNLCLELRYTHERGLFPNGLIPKSRGTDATPGAGVIASGKRTRRCRARLATRRSTRYKKQAAADACCRQPTRRFPAAQRYFLFGPRVP